MFARETRICDNVYQNAFDQIGGGQDAKSALSQALATANWWILAKVHSGHR